LEIKRSIRIFWISFFTALVLAVFCLSLFWVHLRAVDNGFTGFDMDFSVERQDELHYMITAGDISKQIDLTKADRMAAFLQKNERWMFTSEARMFYRIAWFTVNQIKDNSRAAREQDFFRNAGLV